MDRNVPKTILDQLGGNKFVAMTGAKNFVGDGRTLRMTLPRNASPANRLYITLNGLDLYDMRFFRQTGGKFSMKTMEFTPIKETHEKVYHNLCCDQLCEIFEAHTHMYTHL